jgi:hypothetical protein
MRSARCWLALVLLFCLVGCSPRADAQALAGRITPPAGWTRAELRTYDRNNLFDLVDGGADSFFVYNFQRVAVARYQAEGDAVAQVEIWQVATPSDAFGLLSANRAGEPVAVGNGGDTDSGRRLAFWQDRFYVRIQMRTPQPQDTLLLFAQAAASVLPQGGDEPALLHRLPTAGLVEGKAIYFHQAESIASELWLGEGNALGLSAQTEGVLATYTVLAGSVRLLLLRYPKATQAAAGLAALQAQPPRAMLAARAQGNLLAAVCGPADPVAEPLLQQVLEGAGQ